MNRVFSLFLMVALVLGGSLGGAFAGGVALGKSQGEASADAPTAGRVLNGPGPSSGEFGPNRSNSPGQRSGGGGADREGRQGPRDGFDRRGQQGPNSGDAGRQGFRDGFRGRPDGGLGGQRAVPGVIDEVADNQLTITTRQGPVNITLGPDTSVIQVVEGSVDDLIKGARVRVMGPRDDDGKVQARAITLVPEGADGLFGRREHPQER